MKYLPLDAVGTGRVGYQQQVKEANIKRIFDLVRSGKCKSRAELVRMMQLSATSVSAHVEAISEGVMPLISNLLMRYGITADTFVIESIDAVNDESFQRICELMTSNPQIRNETDNMHCLHCHTTLLPSSRFCHVCGQAINGC